MTDLNSIYRDNGYVCSVCNEPYKIAYIYPTTKQICCKQCCDKPNSSEYWYHSPINEQMETLELTFKFRNGLISEDDLDVQNQLAYEAICDQRWDDALENFNRNVDRRTFWNQWKGMTQYILVEACEHPR